jgi:subtilisin family serine protease
MPIAKRTLKVFCSRSEMTELAAEHEVVESYESFVLLRVSPREAAVLRGRFPTEDITDLYTLRIGTRKIDTSRPRLDARGRLLPHAAYRGVKRLPAGKHHYLVQFVGPIKPVWLIRLRRLGAEPREPYVDFAYVVRCSDAVVKRVAGEPFVRWVGHLSHRDRIRIASRRLPRTRALSGVYVLEFFGREDLRRAEKRVRKLGARILSSDEKACLLTLELPVSGARAGKLIEALSAIHGVRTLWRRSLARTSNDVATGLMETRRAARSPLSLDGAGEVVAICDTGLDTGERQHLHPDFAGRLKSIRSYPINPYFDAFIHNPGADDGPADFDSGHGTHVAGSAVGSGAASAGIPGLAAPIRGLAHRAALVFQAVEQEMRWKDPVHYQDPGRYILSGIPDDLTGLFEYAYRKGARIHSNSWGGGDPGDYDAQSRQIDEFVWRRRDFCVVVAAGNDGTDADGDGVINAMSVTPPATAKNCITVGACESRRPQFDAETYGGWWPFDYPVSPYRNAPMANSPDQVVAFSSRGPTWDGRVKPDVVAPGTFILSSRSSVMPSSHMGWAAFAPSRAYFYSGGTSMATPLVSGAVALLRQFLRVWVGFRSPSAALVKACLVAGARKLPGYSPARRVHDHDQGFGRVDIDTVVAPSGPARVYFLDDLGGLRTGGRDDFEIRVLGQGQPLRVAMAYSDAPGEALVNNLNLILEDPRGRRYVGNGAGTGGLEADTRNNVEVLHVRRPRRGLWTLRVVGSNVPQGPQPYAFVASGRIRM